MESEDFQCLERMGHGAYGEVIYRSDGARAPGVEQRVLREAQTWASISHPNIARKSPWHCRSKQVDWETLGTGPGRTEKRQPLPLEVREGSLVDFPWNRESGRWNSTEARWTSTDLEDQESSCESDMTEESEDGVVFLDASKEGAEPTGEHETSVEEVPADGHILAKRTRETVRRASGGGSGIGAGASLVYKATLYIQTELCSKETLQSWISQRNAAVAAGKASKEDLKTWASQAAGIFRQVASSLSKLHERGLAHRDLKPSNILFGVDGGMAAFAAHFSGVRLGDFGLAKLLDRVGTPIYASPEQLSADSYSVKTDIFALGMILAELLCPAWAPRGLCFKVSGNFSYGVGFRA
ncbi:EIF2AK3 [Symbiodinium natans]|uniref:EIF2AK3 protein n=1 Tax=Symbiodinium natans TaxID=878477 RepID=A0A812RBQ5_9DINO|nr:EIF2AK3 [Symbiodinium natans]